MSGFIDSLNLLASVDNFLLMPQFSHVFLHVLNVIRDGGAIFFSCPLSPHQHDVSPAVFSCLPASSSCQNNLLILRNSQLWMLCKVK